MRFFHQVLATVALVASVVSGASPLAPGVYVGNTFGGHHGEHYSDVDRVQSGQRVTALTLRSADRVDAVILDFETPAGQTTQLYHGGKGGEEKTMWLPKGEYITSIEAHWGKYYRHTRIMYMKFTTNWGNVLEGGRKAGKVGVDSAREGYQLGGFVGRSGNELDMVGAIWTSVKPVVES